MKSVNIRYLCQAIGSLSGLPLRLYEGEEQVFFFSVIRFPRDPMIPHRTGIFQIRGHVGYFVTPNFLYYGVLNAEGMKIVIGPTAQVLPGDRSLRELAFQADVPGDETGSFLDAFKALTLMPLESLLMMLSAVNHVLNGEELELSDIAIHESVQQHIKETMEQRRTERKFNPDLKSAPHNTMQVEETLLSIVRSGDSAALRQWMSQAPPVRGGVLAADQLRQLKNTFIVTATLVSRAAIQGGLSPEDALSLSDGFIRQAELLNSQSAIFNLQYRMVLEYTEQVERIRRGSGPTRLAMEVANYVWHHLSEPISTEAMAKEFYLSRTHFSARFRKETGETLTGFILREKMEEAKRLLRYTDKSSAAIGEYLGYSSQGHFSRVFKQYTGETPMDYRESRKKGKPGFISEGRNHDGNADRT
ncbi:MAG: helix-turn-helix domain-containing protein [Lachnospiraceae bacterium]|nr:helix-turn-helix domain-containing protein [Lachnospiraceae bacterium]